MIKAMFAMEAAPDLSIAECQQHWYEVHGRHHTGPTHKLDNYIQHHTLTAAYSGPVRPTHVGVSIVWVKDMAALKAAEETPAWQAATVDGQKGAHGMPVFRYPIACVVGEEREVKDGKTNPYMVKLISVAARNPAHGRDEFYNHWLNVHGPLGAKVPQVRKYVQNYITPATASHPRNNVHDCWSEMWFDSYPALLEARQTPEWAVMTKDAQTGLNGKPLVDASKMCVVIARERPMLEIAKVA